MDTFFRKFEKEGTDKPGQKNQDCKNDINPGKFPEMRDADEENPAGQEDGKHKEHHSFRLQGGSQEELDWSGYWRESQDGDRDSPHQRLMPSIEKSHLRFLRINVILQHA